MFDGIPPEADGRDRTIEHWQDILGQIPLRLTSCTHVDGPYFLLEASTS
jgi:hypothetical protein